MTGIDWQAGTVSVPLWLVVAAMGGLSWLALRNKEGGSQQVSHDAPTATLTKLPKAEIIEKSGPTHTPSKGNSKYRIEEETTKRWSSEYTRRGQLWSRHAAWHLPSAPRFSDRVTNCLNTTRGLEYIRAILKKFDVDPITGFLPTEDPLQRLPYARYHLWEDLADDLPKLLGARLGQARCPLEQLPVLPTDKLITDADLRRAHLLLCLFAHAYVWGGNTPLDRIPQGIAVPLWEVSEKLGVPPVLGHPSIVLYNWRRLDVNGDICMENLSTLNNFFDGRDESWFYLITVEIEARGAAAIVPGMLALDAVQRFHEERSMLKQRSGGDIGPSSFWGEQSSVEDSPSKHYTPAERISLDDEEFSDQVIFVNEALAGELSPARVVIFLTAQLQAIAKAIQGTCESLSAMREGCHPFIFYHRVRPFLSGWKHNPTMPEGILYEGVSDVRQMFYGGSAAQSSLLPFLDIMLGIEHDSPKSRDFLLAMRDYMLRPHREFLTYLEKTTATASPRGFILEMLASIDSAQDAEQKALLERLREAYDSCVINLKRFREGHMALVAEYIIAQHRQKEGKGLEDSAGGRGTGGTELMGFLRPIRNSVAEKIINKEAPMGPKDDDQASKPAGATSSGSSGGAAGKPQSDSRLPVPGLGAISPRTIKKVLNAETTTDTNYYIKEEGSAADIDVFRGASPRK